LPRLATPSHASPEIADTPPCTVGALAMPSRAMPCLAKPGLAWPSPVLN